VKTPISLALSVIVWGGLQVVGAAPAASAPNGDLQVEIQHPVTGTLLTNSEASIEVRGGASIFGGVTQLDLVLVIDTSSSLKNTDPDDYRTSGAIGLVESLPDWSDIQIGVVVFGRGSKLLSPLTTDRDAVIQSLRDLGRGSTTNLAKGIDTGLAAFEQGAREGSTRVMLVFTDGRSNEKKARAAMERSRAQGVAIHSLLLGSDELGERMLREIASGTGGSFLLVTDPTKLPAAFLNLRTTGIESVALSVNDSDPIPVSLTMGSFSGEVPITRGENRIAATVTSLDGTTRTKFVTVTLRSEGCGELAIQAVRDGEPALSISKRSVEVVMDVSRSMWGQIGGEAKMSIAKRTLNDALGWLPKDLMLSLRVYGHQHTPAAHDCEDTQLLVPASENNRAEIRSAIAGLTPKGQTPLGYTLEQLAKDFEGVPGEHAVVLVTDGIESCGGDAPAAAQALQAQGPVPVHVIGFGMNDASDEDLASLQAIADASGGRFLTAASARDLQQALMTTVGTSFNVSYGGTTVGAGALGSGDVIRLPPGEYLVELDSNPPMQLQIALESEVRHTVVFNASAEEIPPMFWRDSAEYFSCNEALAKLEEMHGLPETTENWVAMDAVMGSTLEDSTPDPAMAMDDTFSSPAAPAPPTPVAVPVARERQPRARREALFEIEGGTVEVWRNLRSERTADFAVFVRHSSIGPTVQRIYSGNDLAEAEATALAARNSLRSGGSLPSSSER